jgi:hypothetical protein
VFIPDFVNMLSLVGIGTRIWTEGQAFSLIIKESCSIKEGVKGLQQLRLI